MFEGPRKPELTEAQKTLAKKCEELARVLERLTITRAKPGYCARTAQARRRSRAGDYRARAGLIMLADRGARQRDAIC